jgi:hypothetical protein
MAKKYLSIKSKCSFPLPDRPSFRDNSSGRNAINGFKYWESLPEEAAAIVRCRVYRLYPQIDLRKIADRANAPTSIEIWEGKIPFAADEYEKEFYHRFGAGDFKVSLEEQGVSGMVCDIWFSLTDMDTYPPKIDDRTLLIDSNRAQDYIKWRARRGEPIGGLPEPEKPKEEEGFMELGTPASPAAMLVGGLVDMAKEQVAQSKNEAREAREQARATPDNPNLTMTAANESIKLIADTSREMMKNSGTPDPINLFKAIVEVMPKAPDTAPMFNTILSVVQESNKSMMQLVLNQNTELKNEIVQMRQHTPTAALAVVDPMAKFKEFRDMAEMLGWSRGGSNGVDHAPAKTSAETMAEWMPIIQMGLGILTPLVQALTSKLAPAQPTQPDPAAGGIIQPTNLQAQQPAAPQPDPNSPQAKQLAFLRHIEAAFLTHLLNPDNDGFTFAQWIISGGTGAGESMDGRALYADIKSNMGLRPDGTCGLDGLIQTYAPIWDRAKSDRKSYMKFLTEFFNYDQQGEPARASA